MRLKKTCKGLQSIIANNYCSYIIETSSEREVGNQTVFFLLMGPFILH